MKVAIQIDPINALNMQGDSSLFLAYGLKLLGHEVFYYYPATMFYANESVYAQVKKMSLQYKDGQFHCDETLVHTTEDLNDFELVLIRRNPPFDMGYIATCHMLARLKCTVLNNPYGIINNPEKMSVLNFREYIPDTIIASALSPEVEDFFAKHAKVIVKPLYGFGGNDIELLSALDDWRSHLTKIMYKHGHLVIQRFLKDVLHHGDKRVFMVNGSVVGAFKRMPIEGEVRANMAVGGTAYKTKLTAQEKSICANLGPWLQEQGLFFAGVDLLAEHLIEINITSPTGLLTLHQLDEIAFESVAKQIEDYILIKA
jgi:glutathione synthase